MKTTTPIRIKPKHTVILDDYEKRIEDDVDNGEYSLISSEEFIDYLEKNKKTAHNHAGQIHA